MFIILSIISISILGSKLSDKRDLTIQELGVKPAIMHTTNINKSFVSQATLQS